MAFYIAVDSGGTKTESVLADENGHILLYKVDKGCNPLDIGVSEVQKIIFENIMSLEKAAPNKVNAIYAGIAGANHYDLGLEALIKSKYKSTKARVEDDRRIVVSGTLGNREGCGLICGTGCSLSIVKRGRPIQQIGGIGYLIDTGGSGFDLGQAALRHTFRYLDGRGEYTVLAELLQDEFGKDPWEAIPEIYSGGRALIASLAHHVFTGYELGDPVCRGIICDGARALSELTQVAERYFEEEFPVVMSGGILKRYPEYVILICGGASQKARMIMADTPPVFGAFAEALRQDGLEANDDIRRGFMADYSAVSVRGQLCVCAPQP